MYQSEYGYKLLLNSQAVKSGVLHLLMLPTAGDTDTSMMAGAHATKAQKLKLNLDSEVLDASVSVLGWQFNYPLHTAKSGGPGLLDLLMLLIAGFADILMIWCTCSEGTKIRFGCLYC